MIGEHTDYNEGFVLPMAIEPEIRFACRTRDDGRIRLASTAYEGQISEFSTIGKITRVEVDTSHFKGNYPESCSLEVSRAGSDANPDALNWQELLPNSKLQAHTRHVFVDELSECGAITHARLNIYPDGGVARLRLYGRLAG